MDAERGVVFPLGSLNWDEKAVTLPYTKRCKESSQKMEKKQRQRETEMEREM